MSKKKKKKTSVGGMCYLLNEKIKIEFLFKKV